jgi:glutaminase
MNYQATFQEIIANLATIEDKGCVASYIPELANVDDSKLGIHLTTIDRHHYGIGDANEKFSIQSIAKVLSLALAINIKGDALWQRVGVEPSGSAFNSLIQLEYEQGIPRNPFINAGAIVICDVLVSCFVDAKAEILQFVRQLSGNLTLDYNARIAESEKKTSYRNRALINFMRDFDNIENDIETVLDVYFYLCSIEMTCQELAQTFTFLANNGVNPLNESAVLNTSNTKRINAILQLCGFYDEAGEFAYHVGLPGKSGVGGGIIAVHPGKYSIAVWSPKLNNKGNSYKGMKVLEAFTTILQSSIF